MKASDLTPDDLSRLYAEGKSNYCIAKMLACDPSSVWGRAKRLGVKNPRLTGQCVHIVDNLGKEGRRRGWEKSMRLMGFSV